MMNTTQTEPKHNLMIWRSVGQVLNLVNDFDFSESYALSVLKYRADNLQVQLRRGNQIFIATRRDDGSLVSSTVAL